MRTPQAQRQDVYRRITQEIVATIEAGAGTWRRPWHHDGSATTRPTNVASSRAYQGINRLVLWLAAQAHGYGSGRWGTYRTWLAEGAQVRQGEKATTVVLWKEARSSRDDQEQDAEDDTSRRRLFAKSFFVFNQQQVDNYEPKATAPGLPESARLTHAEAFLAALHIPTTEGPSTPITVPISTASSCRRSPPSTPRPITSPPSPMSARTDQGPGTASIATSPAASAPRPMPPRNASPSSPPASSWPISASRTSRGPTTPPILPPGSRS